MTHKGTLLQVREVLTDYMFSDDGNSNNDDVTQALARLDALIAAVPDVQPLLVTDSLEEYRQKVQNIDDAAQLLHEATTGEDNGIQT